jgi:outer membrane protein assembly factor BamA
MGQTDTAEAASRAVAQHFSLIRVLGTAFERAYISPMRRPEQIRFMILLAICASLCSPVVLAQSRPALRSRCAPTVSCDELKELSGKKAYPKVIIDDVVFDGPVNLPHEALDRVIKDLTSREFDGDSQWLEEIEEVAIRGAWQDHGFFKAEVSGQAISHGGDATYQHFSVIFHVEEGSQYWIGRITFQSSGPDEPLAFSAEELRNLLPFRPGDLCAVDKIRQGLDALKMFYGARGYIDFAPAPETEVDSVKQVVNLKMVLDQQKQYKIDKLTVCGSNPKFENLLRSEIKPGDVWNAEVAEGFFERYRPMLGPHFGSENVQYKRDVKKGTVDIAVSLQNCHSSQD